MTWKAVLPSIVAATAGVAVYFLVSGTLLINAFVLPEYDAFRDIDLLYSILLGIVGAGIGIFFITIYKKMRRFFEPYEDRPILLGLAGGIGLGIAGMLLPVTLFMGSEQLQFLINHYMVVSVLLLIAIVVVKILLITFSFSTGFAGGYIFRVSSSAGPSESIHHLFPAIPLAVCIVCVIAAVSVSLLRSPIAIALIIAIVFQLQTPSSGRNRSCRRVHRESPVFHSLHAEHCTENGGGPLKLVRKLLCHPIF